ncbi:hypothetical protein H671_5g14459 [Cricetulus griseus]|nr:hypothetical protein H671_5g14459 [Cricetulus griseus]
MLAPSCNGECECGSSQDSEDAVTIFDQQVAQAFSYSVPRLAVFVYMVDYTDEFSYVEPSLHLWDAAHLIMVVDLFDVLLDSVYQYFIEYFASMFMRDIVL